MKKEKKGSKLLTNILLVICAGVFLFSSGTLLKIYLNYKKIEDNYNAIKNDVVVVTPESEGKYPKVDVAKLIEQNPSCIGYIMIPDTDISYPIMQASTNQYYLDVGFDEQWSNGGSIFIDYRNEKDWSDDNTIVYGHNMKNGSMFAPAAKYLYDYDFFYGHPNILIYTKDTIDVYTVFSCVSTDEGSEVYTLNFPSQEAFDEHVKTMANNSSYTPNTIPTNVKGTITLSTCRYSEGPVRICIMAALTEQLPNE